MFENTRSVDGEIMDQPIVVQNEDEIVDIAVGAVGAGGGDGGERDRYGAAKALREAID